MTNEKFTVGGIILFGTLLWATSQSAMGDARKILNLFLFVLLTSMVLLNWHTIKPYVIKG